VFCLIVNNNKSEQQQNRWITLSTTDVVLYSVSNESYFWFTARPICPMFTKVDISDATGYLTTLAPKSVTSYKLLAPLMVGFDSYVWILHKPLLLPTAFVIKR
jgi:hypothetical protein